MLDLDHGHEKIEAQEEDGSEEKGDAGEEDSTEEEGNGEEEGAEENHCCEDESGESEEADIGEEDDIAEEAATRAGFGYGRRGRRAGGIWSGFGRAIRGFTGIVARGERGFGERRGVAGRRAGV